MVISHVTNGGTTWWSGCYCAFLLWGRKKRNVFAKASETESSPSLIPFPVVLLEQDGEIRVGDPFFLKFPVRIERRFVSVLSRSDLHSGPLHLRPIIHRCHHYLKGLLATSPLKRTRGGPVCLMIKLVLLRSRLRGLFPQLYKRIERDVTFC